MSRSRRTWSSLVTVVVLAAGCGDDDSSTDRPPSDVTSAASSAATAPDTTPPDTTPPATDPPGGDVTADPRAVPAEMCPAGAWPVVAAYDIDTGGLRWTACEPGGGLYLMAAAAQDTVWVLAPGQESPYRAFDAANGDELWRGDDARFTGEVPDDADVPVVTPPLIEGVQLAGGQDDAMTGTDDVTGEVLWTQPGRLVYDDAWAVGDGAVFAVESPALVAYEVTTGDVRWRRDLTEYLWPWHVTGERLLVMWNNLQVVATDDGSVLWETAYPESSSGFPRMMGGLANSDSVFVSFTSEASGGD